MPHAKDHNSKQPKRTADEIRRLFITHRTSWNEVQAKLKVVEKLVSDVKSALKSDGYTVKQMQIADQLATVKGDAKVQAEVKDRLQVAQWMGHPMGAQLDMFSQPDRTPAVDRAFEDGKTAGMEGRVRRPPHSPETPQHESWMNGYYQGQEILQGKVGTGALADQPGSLQQ